jgi:glycosyltransferase involved in cell wall biosynthesis
MGAKKNNVEVFPLGVNFQDFKPMGKSLELQKELGIKENDKVIVFVGTMYTFAGLELLIKKYDSFENTKIIIIGGGPDFNRIKLLVKSKNLEKNIKLLGFIPQNSIAKYIALSDICINPFEINQITNRILPTKILEYLACKKPVISTPLNGTKEILLDENFGVIYATGNNFVEKLVSTLKNKEEMEKIGTAGYSYVTKHHDWKKLSTQVLEKIQNIQYKD